MDGQEITLTIVFFAGLSTNLSTNEIVIFQETTKIGTHENK